MALIHMNFLAPSLGMQTQVYVVIPEGKKKNKEMPLVYLLHGLSDNASNWTRRTSIERYADEKGVIVIMPEVQRSFYTNTGYGARYYDYITKDLPRMAESFFGCNTSRENSYIAGLSMGGYGALKCGLSLPDNYAGIASFSAVCDIQGRVERALRMEDWPKSEIQGVFGADCRVADEENLLKLVEKAAKAKNRPRIIITCGTEDELYPENLVFKDKLIELKFDPEYQEWEDGHSWGFWDVSIQLAFDYFFDPPDEALDTEGN